MAQVPQGVGYQGVATDANGIELVNQSISIRASVLSGSATGTIEWEETHATSTDTFGLFTLTIGQGTNTTNGLQTSFADISWGTNTYFLKIEMDVTGGSTYSNMGTNQMMSVPYALFAESANINYDSISNLLSNDSTFITNVGGGLGGGGCDFRFPDGLNGEPFEIELSGASTYTPPQGKRLYIFKISGNGAGINGIFMNNPVYSPFFLSSNDQLEVFSGAGTLGAYGYLVDDHLSVEPITMELSGVSTYTPQQGKRLYVLNFNQASPSVDGIYMDPTSIIPMILDDQNILSVYGGSANLSFNGYLVDENYFANCGGGGSSSSTSNATIDSLSQVVSNLDSLLNSLFGCTDVTACNYNPLAAFDNGSCSGFLGCMDATAINYNAIATCDDNSCATGNEAIGDIFQGGVIFYLDGNGGGLIAAPSDQTSAEWGCNGTLITYTELGIGTGYQNTNAILFPSWCISQSSPNSIAADICTNLTLGGYSDWFLPSLDELNEMYLNKSVIGGFINGDYWSSSEDDATKAWRQDFGNGSTSGVVLAPSKNATLNVRAIRAF